MDATPVTLGQEFGGYAAAIEHGVERLEAALPTRGRAAPRRHGGRDGAERRSRLRSQGDRAARRRDRACPSPRPATTSRPRARATRSSRPPVCCGRSPCRSTRSRTTSGGCPPARAAAWRDPPARSAAGLVDNAGEGEPGRPRGRLPGGGAGRRQRRRRRLRGRGGQLRAQRDAARDRQQPARVHPAAGVGERRPRRQVRRAGSSPTRSGAGPMPSPRLRSPPRSIPTSATSRRPRS